MEWWVFLTIGLGGLLVLLGTGIPVAIAFLALDAVGLYLLKGTKGLGLIVSSMFDSVGSISMGAIPLFYFLGEILMQSKAVHILLNVIDSWVGQMRARLCIVSILTGTVLGTLSGSAMADSAVLGSTLLPEMIRRGYDRRLAAGSIMSAGSLAAIIPPSILAVVLGGLAQVSIAELLISGILPGFLLSAIFILYVLIRVKLKPELAPTYPSSEIPFSEKMRALFKMLPFLVIIFLVLGLILLGIATPTESAATGAIGAMIVTKFYGRLKLQVIKTALVATLRLTGMIFFIIAGAQAFSQLLALSGATRGLLQAITQAELGPVMMFVIMQFIPFFLGCFLEQISIMMIAVPIYAPMVAYMHFDPIWFWIIFLINLTVGAITPPFGLVLFVLKGASQEISMADVYKASTPFLMLVILGIILIAIFPDIALWLPKHFSD